MREPLQYSGSRLFTVYGLYRIKCRIGKGHNAAEVRPAQGAQLTPATASSHGQQIEHTEAPCTFERCGQSWLEVPQRENAGVPERAKEGTRSLVEGSDIVLNADYYLTTIEKTPGDIILQGLRGFLINHRKFVQHTPNPCAETACSLRPYNSDSKGRWFESSRAYQNRQFSSEFCRFNFFIPFFTVCSSPLRLLPAYATYAYQKMCGRLLTNMSAPTHRD